MILSMHRDLDMKRFIDSVLEDVDRTVLWHDGGRKRGLSLITGCRLARVFDFVEIVPRNLPEPNLLLS